MTLFSFFLISIGLAMDAFAVSITCGISIKKTRLRYALLIGSAFGFFHAFMLLLGWTVGRWTYHILSAVDYWIAFGLLLFVGGHMIFQAIQPKTEEDALKNPLHPRTLLSLSLAISLDAFAVGVSLSMLRVSVLQTAVLISLVTLLLSFTGVCVGSLSRSFDEKKVEVAGGLILIALGVKILIENLVANGTLFSESQAVWLAFALTLAAGLATGIGSLLALFLRRTDVRSFSFFLGISCGLLLWTAFREVLPLAETSRNEMFTALPGFFGGILIIAWIDRLVPAFGNPHEPPLLEHLGPDPEFRRAGMPGAMGIAAHSFPEGLALFVVALHAPVPVAAGAAVALALHNIPEGIATALPMYHATGSRAKACFFSALTGLAEPLGALIAYTLFHRFFSDTAPVLLTSASAGILVFIALDGLLPAARTYGKAHHAIGGVITGMLIAALLGAVSGL